MIATDLQLVVRKINERCASDGMFEFNVYQLKKGFRSDTLTIVASADLSYYHQLEIKLGNVQFFSGAFDWQAKTETEDAVHIISGDEFFKLSQHSAPPDSSVLLAFANEHGRAVLIACEDVETSFDTVYYYQRSDLKPGERLADWVASGFEAPGSEPSTKP